MQFCHPLVLLCKKKSNKLFIIYNPPKKCRWCRKLQVIVVLSHGHLTIQLHTTSSFSSEVAATYQTPNATGGRWNLFVIQYQGTTDETIVATIFQAQILLKIKSKSWCMLANVGVMVPNQMLECFLCIDMLKQKSRFFDSSGTHQNIQYNVYVSIPHDSSVYLVLVFKLNNWVVISPTA